MLPRSEVETTVKRPFWRAAILRMISTTLLQFTRDEGAHFEVKKPDVSASSPKCCIEQASNDIAESEVYQEGLRDILTGVEGSELRFFTRKPPTHPTLRPGPL